MHAMDIAAELAKFNATPEMISHVENLLSGLQQERDLLHERTIKAAEEIQYKDLHIEKLTLHIAYLNRMKFGARSEALQQAHPDLFDETLDADLAECEKHLAALREESATSEPVAAPQDEDQKRPRAGRQALPAHLPRIVIRHEPESTCCPECGESMVLVGEDVTEKLTIIPAQFEVERHVYPKYACRPCETIQSEPAIPSVITGGMATPALLAWVAVSKYVDHLPLYRLEEQAKRSDLILSRSTLASWIGQLGVVLEPLVHRLIEHLLRDTVLHADETPVKQLDPGRGKTKTAQLWAYRSNVLGQAPPIVVFDYQSGRSGQHSLAFLRDWNGHLMVDDYAGYKALFRGKIIELGCMAHARRKFFDLLERTKCPVSEEALKRIGELYAIEDRTKDMPPEMRAAIRREHSQPRLEAMHLWLQATRRTVANGSALAKAIDYSLRRWPALTYYATAGDLPIDNNPVENAIRPIALGKKNWLFAGSEAAGRRAANIQSLLGTARLNGLDPMRWLAETLEKLPTWPNRRIDELLPFKK